MAIKLGKSIVKIVRLISDDEMIIKPRFYRWLERHADDPFSPEVADWVRNQLVTAERDRTRSFSSSSGGRCMREQLFGYLGVKQPSVLDAQMEQIFQDGTWRHLRLQAQLAESGIIELDGLEYPLDWPNMRSRGTVDGVGTVPMDHPNKAWRGKIFGLELKGANTFVVGKMDDPTKFIRQVARYLLSGGFDLFIIFVEDKNTQDVREWVIDASDRDMQKVIQEQKEELEELNAHIDQQTVPPMLLECLRGVGRHWKDCAFGGHATRPCPQIASYAEAQKFVPIRRTRSAPSSSA